MMSLNRYRLKHKANEGHRGAKLANRLLGRVDRLIGVILIGNNLVNNMAATLFAVLAVRLFGNSESVLALAPIVLTLIMLIFAEVTPKTIAALHPERVAFPAGYVLRPLLTVFYPVVLLVNRLSNLLVHLAGVNPKQKRSDDLGAEELKTVVNESANSIPDEHQGMLINVLELENATVEDILIPRNEVVGIDLESDLQIILKQLREVDYTRLPVYEGDINKICGELHMRDVAKLLRTGEDALTKSYIRRICREPYFIPESTPLTKQLLQFQKEKRRLAVVVNEYGDVQGIATLEDLLEEIVGDFTTNKAEADQQDIILGQQPPL